MECNFIVTRCASCEHNVRGSAESSSIIAHPKNPFANYASEEAMATKAGTLTPPATPTDQLERETTFDIFRRWGYLQASLDPLGQYLPPEPFPVVAVPEG